jgi:hypothetical protein
MPEVEDQTAQGILVRLSKLENHPEGEVKIGVARPGLEPGTP